MGQITCLRCIIHLKCDNGHHLSLSGISKNIEHLMHFKSAANIQWNICRGYKIETTEKFYKYQPTIVSENN